MTCLAPLALFGLLLLALPIVVHLFKPRKMKEMPFSSLRWLKATHERLSRRIEWHQWLLFLLRAGCVALLVFALAKPMLGLWGGRAVDRFVIVDVNRSMAYKDKGGRASSLDRAKELAGRLAQLPRVGDRTTVILAGGSPVLLVEPGADATKATGLLAEVKAGESDGTITSTLPLVQAFKSSANGRDTELIFLMDNLQGRWQHKDVQAFLKEFSGTLRVKVVEVGPTTASNAWIAEARFFETDEKERWIRVWVGCNRDSDVARSVRLTGITGVDDQTKSVELKPGQLSRVDFAVPATASLQGQVAELRLEPTDALPSDDRYFLNLDASLALRVLLIEPETPGADGRTIGIYLQTATAALASDKAHSIDLTTRTSKAVAAGEIEKADIIILASAAELADSVVDAIETRVRAGAGLAIFLGPAVSPDFVNQKLHRAQQPAEGLLPFTLKMPDWQIDAVPSALTNLRWRHPVLAGLQDPLLSDLTQSRFSGRAKVAGTLGRNDVVVARFEDDFPAIVDRPFGAGRVLVLNMSANHEWGDLQPKRKSFVPLWDRTLSHLSAGGVRRSYAVGDAVTIALPATESRSAVTVTGPGGETVPHRVIAQGGLAFLHVAESARAGTYRVEGSKGNIGRFVVNVKRFDSAMQAMDGATLTDWWAPAHVELMTTDAAAQEIDQQSRHWPIWPALVLLACVLLIAETIYVHWLCPRANPKTADAVVTGQGMLKPSAPEA